MKQTILHPRLQDVLDRESAYVEPRLAAFVEEQRAEARALIKKGYKVDASSRAEREHSFEMRLRREFVQEFFAILAELEGTK